MQLSLPQTGQRESEREREREKDRERRRERGESEKYICIYIYIYIYIERERDVEYGCFILFLKGMMGALAPFSYLVIDAIISYACTHCCLCKSHQLSI